MCIGLDLRWCKCRCCNPSSTCLPPSQVGKGLFWLDGNLSSPDEQIPAHPCRCSCSRFACTRLSPLTHRCNSCNGRSTSLPPGESCLTHLTCAPTIGDPHLVCVPLLVLALARLPCALHQPAGGACATVVALLSPGVANLRRQHYDLKVQKFMGPASPDACTPGHPCTSWCTAPSCT